MRCFGGKNIPFVGQKFRLVIAWLSLCFILETSWVALFSVCEWVSEWVCQASVTPDQISTFSNIYRHTSPLLTMYHLISSSTNLYWPSTSQYRHILTQYHQVPLIIHHLMSHAQYTWSSLGGFYNISLYISSSLQYHMHIPIGRHHLVIRCHKKVRSWPGLMHKAWLLLLSARYSAAAPFHYNSC